MKRLIVLLILAACTPSLRAGLTTYSFDRITYNLIDCTDAEVGEGQFFVDISDNGLMLNPDDPSQWLSVVSFNFRNDGPVPSVISEIYFDADILALLAAIDDSMPGVDFKDDYSGGNKVKPANLPGGGTVGFVADTSFSAEAENPEPENGIGPGEWVRIDYAVQYGMDYQDVITQLGDGSLRIGLHVKAINCDPGDPAAESASESFISIPEPMTLLLLGLGGLALLRKRK